MTEPANWRDLRDELNADQITELEELESNLTLTNDGLLAITRLLASWNLDDAMVDVPEPPVALRVGHWTTIGGEKTREYTIVKRVVGDIWAELRGKQRVDGSTDEHWITVVGDDPHLTVEQVHSLATALHELAAMLESVGGAS